MKTRILLVLPILMIVGLAVAHAHQGSKAVRYGEEMRQLEQDKQELIVINRNLTKELSIQSSIAQVREFAEQAQFVEVSGKHIVEVTGSSITYLGY